MSSNSLSRGSCRQIGAICGAILVAMVCTGLAADDKKAAAPSLKDIRAELDAAQRLLDEGRPAKASDKLSAAVAAIDGVLRGDTVPSGLRQLVDRCKGIKSDLELEGIDVAAITIPSLAPKARAAADKDGAKGAKGDVAQKTANDFFGKPAQKPPAPEAVSFSRDIAPMLVRSCGNCHVTARKGGFQFASYADLMQTGVVQRGAGQSSRLVEVILSGDMPRGGGKVAPGDIGTLTRWIDAGAAFDGADPRVPLAALGGPPRPADKPADPKPTVVAKVGQGEVSFAQDVAPVLHASCFSCHGGAEVEAGFNMKTFATLFAGGQSGAAVLPGRGADSLLVKKLRGKGIEGQRMPLNKPPLPDDVIVMIERWVNEGARFDAGSDREDLPNVVAAGRALKLSHDELAKIRFAAAKNFWSRAIPDEPPEIAGSGAVRVIGNLSSARTNQVLEEAQAVWTSVERELSADAQALKGGIIVYALARPFDFSELWRLLYRTERPKDVVGSAGLAGDVAYAALLVPVEGAEEDMPLLLAEQMAAAVFAARGVPAWFAQGAGRAVAIKAVPKAPLAKTWRKQAIEALPAVGSPEDFLGGMSADTASARAVAGGFVSSLAGSSPRLREMLGQLDDRVPFEKAFAAVFRGSPSDLFKGWVALESARPRRR